MATHFATEEKYFDKFKYANAKEHKEEHIRFRKHIDKMSQAKEGHLELSFELIDFLEDWLINHVKDMDQKYVECFKSHGLS